MHAATDGNSPYAVIAPSSNIPKVGKACMPFLPLLHIFCLLLHVLRRVLRRLGNTSIIPAHVQCTCVIYPAINKCSYPGALFPASSGVERVHSKAWIV